MFKAFREQWHAVAGMVEVASDTMPDICSVYPGNFGQDRLPRSMEETYAIAKFIAAGPRMFALLERVVAAGEADDETVELVALLREYTGRGSSPSREEVMTEALEQCQEYFDQRMDVTWEGTSPNEEMVLHDIVDCALKGRRRP